MAKKVNILAFDTSASACSVALSFNGKIDVIHQVAPMQQATLILSHIQSLLDRANTSLTQLDAVAYGRGPGSFTGIRIASSVAQGMGFGLNLPLLPISSLAVLAQAAFNTHQWRSLFVLLDGRANHVYSAYYEVNGNGYIEQVGKENFEKIDQLIMPSIKPWYGVGDGWQKYKNSLDQQGYRPLDYDISPLFQAESMIKIATIQLQQGRQVSAAAALPLYLR